MLMTPKYVFLLQPKIFITAVSQLVNFKIQFPTSHLGWPLTFYLSTHLKMNLCSLVFLKKYLKYPTLLSFSSNSPVTPADSARQIGFIFDSSLKFSLQILSLSSTCNYHICDLRRIRHTLYLKTACVIASSLVHSKLDYCKSLYLNLLLKNNLNLYSALNIFS